MKFINIIDFNLLLIFEKYNFNFNLNDLNFTFLNLK